MMKNALGWLLCSLFLCFGAVAQAQDIDWNVNLDDSGSDPMPAGGVITYNLEISNSGNGPAAAPTTPIELTIPANTTFTGITGGLTGCTPAPPQPGPTTITCQVPSLAPSAAVAAAIEVTTISQGGVTFGANVPASDSQNANNAATESTTVTSGADLSLDVSGPAGPISSGSAVTYDFEVNNSGPDPVSDVQVTIPVPTGLSSITAPAGCVLSGSNYTCTIPGPIAVGASESLSIDGILATAGGSTVSVLGSISGSDPLDPNAANDSDTQNTTVTGGSDVSISKTRAPLGTLLVGDTADFTLAAEYTGDSPNGLTITDTIPANYQINSVTPAPGSGWTCTVTGQLVECNRAAGAGPGAAVSLGSVVINTTVVTAGSATNRADISSTGPADPNTSNNSDTDEGATIEEPFIDLRANKTGPNPALAVVGVPFDFSISATNVGNADYTGTVVMTDSIPANMRITAIDQNGWTCTPAPTITGPTDITCTLIYPSPPPPLGAPLQSNETTPPVTLTAVMDANVPLTNRMQVSSQGGNLPDNNGPNDIAEYSVTAGDPVASADVSVNKTVSPATVASGEDITFTLELVNAGPTPATDVDLIDTFAQLTNDTFGDGFVSYTITDASGIAPAINCSNASAGITARTLNCNVPTMNVCTAGSNCPTIAVTVKPGGNAGTRTNTASFVSQVTPDPNTSNNTGSVSYQVTPLVDVTVTKVGAPKPAKAGQNITYVITAENLENGWSDADNVTINDTLPLDVTFISATPSSGTCGTTPPANATTTAAARTVSCDLGTIVNGAQQTVLIVVRPNNVTRGTTIQNDVTVSTSTPEPATNVTNSASDLTQIEDPILDLLINKTDSVDPVTIGDDTVYTITVNNQGPSSSENIIVEDTMPASGLSYQSVTTTPSTGVICTQPAVGSFGGTLSCTFPLLPAGDTATIEVTARATAKGVVTNNANVASDETRDGFENASNNDANERTTVRTRVDLAVTSKTPSAGPYNVREPFNFVISVANLVGAGLGDADDVTVADTLPTNMVLNGPPVVSVTAGTAGPTSCTGAAGDPAFSCNFGTFSNGGTADITIPVIITAVTSFPQSFTNTATISTAGSFDGNSANDSSSGTVSVNSSTLSGNVYRDFDNDGAIDGVDTGIGGVPVTISGTAIDGRPFTQTVTTAPDGSYTFNFVPAGTNYTITRGAPGEAYLQNGVATPGANGGTAGSPTVISGVSIGSNVNAPDYNFGLVPQARIAIAKRTLSAPVINADGSYTTTFRLIVDNLSLETVQNINVTDQLAGAAPLFGSHVTLAAPTTDPMTAGTYTMVPGGVTPGNCGGIQAGFNGASAPTIATGFSLASGATCAINFQIRVRPTVPLPSVLPSGGRYENQATVTGEGALTGQTSATNPLLRDLSDNGSNADPDGDGNGNEAGENDPTPVAPSFDPQIRLIKTADTSALSSPPVPNEQITYRFRVENTGNVTLTNVTVVENLIGATVTGGPITLTPGQVDTTTFTATYQITQANIDDGEVRNSARASGTDPYNTVVTDDSGSTNGDDNPLVTPIDQNPQIRIIKTATPSLSSPPAVGDGIVFNFSVQNTGNVTLTNVRVTESLPGVVLSGAPLTLAPGATSPAGHFTGTYALIQSDIESGEVRNQATALGDPPSGPPVTDLSGTTNGDDAPTVVPVPQVAGIDLDKEIVATVPAPSRVGDTVTYRFTVRNTGNVILNNVRVSEALAGAVVTGGPISLAPGATDTATFQATYVLQQPEVDAGTLVNNARVDAESVAGAVNDTDTETLTITPDPSISLVKTADITGLSANPVAGETIIFRFAIENTGNVTLTNVNVNDLLPGVAITGTIASLAPGATDTTSITGSYNITQDNVDDAQVENTADVTGTPPTGPDVTDRDVIIAPFTQAPSITIVKTATPNFSTPPVAGDTITYNFEVRNTGNVRLTNVIVTDPLPDIVLSGGPIPVMNPGDVDNTTFTATYTIKQSDINAGGVNNQATVRGTDPGGAVVDDLSGSDPTLDDPTVVPISRDAGIALVKTATPSFSSPPQPGDVIDYSFTVQNTGNVTLTNVTLADPLPGIVLTGGPIASLEPGVSDSTTFTGRYVLTQNDIDAGEVDNQATVTGTPPTGPNVSDPSGSTITDDDPTETPVPQTPGIELVKTVDDSAFLDGPQPGDQLTYTFTVTNTGNVTIQNVTLSDPLPGIVLSGGPIASMAPGAVDSTTFTATYTPTAADIANGSVLNTATVDGVWGPGSTPINDSDDATAIVAAIEAVPETFPPFLTDGGTTTSVLDSDTERGAPATLSTVTITVISEDPGVSLDPTTGLITLDPGQPAGPYEVLYEICSVLVPTVCDQTTETVVQLPLPSIELTKTQATTDNGDGMLGVGDLVTYTFVAENTGNVPLDDVAITDTFTTRAGTPLSLDTGPTFVSASAGSPEGDLAMGESATYTATFRLTVQAVADGGLSNSARVDAMPVYGPGVIGTPQPVSDVSDDGNDLDGNTTDDPTELEVDPALAPSGLTIEKTTPRGVVARGDVVPYTITLRNESPVVAGPLNIVDVLPAGFLYAPNSATLDGNPYTVTVQGRVITWNAVPVPPQGAVTLTLNARVTTGAPAGEHVNTATARDPATGSPVVAPATATVRIMPEAVFDCGDIIGKVFEDKNADGYQNPPRGGVTEPGISGARLIGVDGTVITTDQHGRFNVPCAMLPRKRGSNFILKLDTASLPSGYRLTTENPRVVRLTPGKMTEMNFGASLVRVVRVDLSANAFSADSKGRAVPSPALRQGVAKLLARIKDEPTVIRLAYHVPRSANAKAVRRARALMKMVEKDIRRQWRRVGQVKLSVEQTIVRR